MANHDIKSDDPAAPQRFAFASWDCMARRFASLDVLQNLAREIRSVRQKGYRHRHLPPHCFARCERLIPTPIPPWITGILAVKSPILMVFCPYIFHPLYDVKVRHLIPAKTLVAFYGKLIFAFSSCFSGNRAYVLHVSCNRFQIFLLCRLDFRNDPLDHTKFF